MSGDTSYVLDITSFRRMFYLIGPNETSFQNVEEVPQYLEEAIPVFCLLLILEALISVIKGDGKVRVNDGISSMSAAIFSRLPNVPAKMFALGMYCWIYDNYRLVDLPWNSPYTWYLTLLSIDFVYYWIHRWSHEVNLLWAAHQVHHSSEDYNLTTALRQSMLQRFVAAIIYLPLALALPPAGYIAHEQFNLLYQFCVHTQYIKTLGPLEWVLATPSHHRVHHGRNRYCIDKNYGGVFIIWDRLFGTFEPEAEEVVYGVTHPINTFGPVETQFCHFKYMWRRICQLSTLPHRVSAVIKGPGWDVGKPWCGKLEDIPDVHAPVESYNSTVPAWCCVYITIHYFMVVHAYVIIDSTQKDMEMWQILLSYGGILFSLISFGQLFDRRHFAPTFELLRCMAFICLDVTLHMMGYQDMYDRPLWQNLFQYWFIFSAILWILYLFGFSMGALKTDNKKLN